MSITATDIQRLREASPRQGRSRVYTRDPLDKLTAAIAAPQLQASGIEVDDAVAVIETRRRAPAVPLFARPAPAVEVVVPVYNEQADLERSVRRLRGFLDTSFPFESVVTVADNASTDSTWSIAERLSTTLPGVRAVHLDQKGRGRALRATWLASDADVVAYMDVDLATDLRALLPLVAPLVSGHSDVAIGSRLARGARVRRGPKRELISRCYNLLLRTALRARFSDAQCGFKAVRSEVARELVPIVADNAWFFDTELLVVAERSGLRLHEVPVDWVDDPDSRVDIWRTAVDDLTGIWRLLRTRPAAIGKLTPPAMARRTEWELGAGQPESPAFLPGRDNVATPPATDYYQTWAARPFLRRGGRPEEACGPRRAASRARKWTRSRFLQFALVGALNTGIAFAVFNMSTAWLGLPAATANVIAWTAGFVNSFVWNRSWTFRDRRELPARTVLMRFAAVNTVALAVSEGVLVSLEALANSVGLTDALGRTLTLNGAEAASIGVALCVNYLLSSRWAFGRPSGALSA